MIDDGPQRRRLLRMLRAAGPRGVHTFDARRAFIGNPSERRSELERDGYVIRVGPRERLNGRSYGVRYFLDGEPTSGGAA